MAKYLHTQAISAAVVDLLKGAKQKLYLISPYLKLSDTLRDRLRDKNDERVPTYIIFGKSELAPAELEFLHGLKHVRLFYSKNLHAKCYLNESQMIITSMNLYEFSQQNNREMGVLIDRKVDGDLAVYEDAWSDILSIQRNAEEQPRPGNNTKAPSDALAEARPQGLTNPVRRSASAAETLSISIQSAHTARSAIGPGRRQAQTTRSGRRAATFVVRSIARP